MIRDIAIEQLDIRRVKMRNDRIQYERKRSVFSTRELSTLDNGLL